MKKVEIEVYDFKELPENVQNDIIDRFCEFEISTSFMSEDSPAYQACLKAEELQTPWFLNSIFYHDFGGKEIVEEEVNQHLYFKNGAIYV